MKRIMRIFMTAAAVMLLLALTACAASGNGSTKDEPSQAGSSAESKSGDETQPEEPSAAPSSAEESETPTEEETSSGSLDYLKFQIKETFDGSSEGYTFRVGVGKGIITPEIGLAMTGYSPSRDSTGVHDNLNIIIYAFEQNGKVILWAVMDTTNCGDMVKSFKTLISLETGVPAEDIFLSATHTHSGPFTLANSQYKTNILYPAAKQAARDAIEGLQWAEMGVSTIESQVGVNRREMGSNGLIKLGQDPNGAYDPTMTVISFRNHAGEPIGNIVHYGAHNTASGKNTEISRDWCGFMKDAMEDLTGGITAFLNGAQGNVGPRITSGGAYGDGTMRYTEEIGAVAAKDAADCWKTITEYRKDCKLSLIHSTIDVPYAELPSEEELTKEIAIYKKIVAPNNEEKDYLSGLEAALTLVQGKRSYDALEVDAYFFALGDVCFVPTPFENFAEMILDIRARSPYRYTLVVSNTNGKEGYFITKEEIPRGGYEARQYWLRTKNHSTPWLIENGTEIFADRVIGMLEEMAAAK